MKPLIIAIITVAVLFQIFDFIHSGVNIISNNGQKLLLNELQNAERGWNTIVLDLNETTPLKGRFIAYSLTPIYKYEVAVWQRDGYEYIKVLRFSRCANMIDSFSKSINNRQRIPLIK